MPFGFKYLYIPHGPVVTNLRKFDVIEFKKTVEIAAKRNNCIFVRVELPFFDEARDVSQMLNESSFVLGKHIQPQYTTQVELINDETLLAKMHHKTWSEGNRG